MSAPPDAESTLTVRPVRLLESLRAHRVGTFDPTARASTRAMAMAFRVGGAPVVLELTQEARDRVAAAAWGAPAREALALAPAICGHDDEAESFQPAHEGLARLVRTHRGVRLPRVPWLFETMVSVVLQQRVAFAEAARAFRALVTSHGEPAPGPHGLRVLCAPATLLALPSHAFRAAWIDGKREAVLRAVAERADLFERLRAAPRAEVRAALAAIPGIGPWSLESAMGWSLGDADAVPTGDYWLPHTVARALAGEERGTDARMLELLEPFRPHRFRVLRLLFTAGIGPPRHGPRRHTGLTPRRGAR